MSQQEKLSLDFAPPNLGGKGFASRVPSSMLLAPSPTLLAERFGCATVIHWGTSSAIDPTRWLSAS
jgi:hypothetical protein